MRSVVLLLLLVLTRPGFGFGICLLAKTTRATTLALKDLSTCLLLSCAPLERRAATDAVHGQLLPV